MAANEYQVRGMTCGHCETSVRDEVGALPGVEEVQVSAHTGELLVTGSGEIDDARVLAAVEASGYSAVRAAPAATRRSRNTGGPRKGRG